MTSGVSELHAQGDSLKNQEKYTEAMDFFQRALVQEEGFVPSHMALADLYGRTGDHESAIKHAERVCQLEPQNPASYAALSVTYQRAFSGTRDPRFLQMAEEAMARGHEIQTDI
jgi:tetratricopeptide (TPR) repeat protein